jgi:hypothetical protein
MIGTFVNGSICICINWIVITNTNTAIDKSTDHGDDINWGIDPESETQNESQMSESNNKTTETESEKSEHRKYRQVSEKLWAWH